jgi:hypothetical protein
MDEPLNLTNTPAENLEAQLLEDFLRSYHNMLKHQVMLPEEAVDAVEMLERKMVQVLWKNYRQITKLLSYPETEASGHLPLIPTQRIYGEGFNTFLSDFLQKILVPALGAESHCLYLNLCIWDPLRIDSSTNWAVTECGINRMPTQIKSFHKEIAAKDLDIYYLLYKQLKKEVLVLAVSDDDTVKTDAIIENLVPEEAEDKTEITDKFHKAIKAHSFLHVKGESTIYVYYIPTLFYPKGAGTGIGGLILISKYSFKPESLVKLQTILDSTLSKLGVIYLFASFFDQSVRSAISSVMARNMSHNIGSHVIPRATVDSVRRRLEDLKLCSSDDLSGQLKLLTLLKGNLDEYAQRKADFLAEITTEPLMATRPAFLYREVILPFVENTLLMDNIAANESIRYDKTGMSNRLKIRVYINGRELKGIYQCTPCVKQGRPTTYTYPDKLPYSLRCLNHLEERLQIVDIQNGEHDVEVELPGPLGEFALYSFLENYIRNSAKHNKSSLKAQESLEISISIEEFEDEQSLEFYQIKIWNNVADPNKRVNMVVGRVLYRKLKDAVAALINAKIIQADGSLRRQAWGISEMKICAILLRGPKDFIKAMDENNLIVTEREIDGAQRLVYNFRLMKSKKICAVIPSLTGKGLKDRLKKEGLWVFNSIRELKNSLGREDSIATFRFAVFDCSERAGREKQNILDEFQQILPKFPFRILVLRGGQANLDLPKGVQQVAATSEALNITDRSGIVNDVYQWVWRQWLQRWLVEGEHHKTAVVNVYLEQQIDEEPTSRWALHARKFNDSSREVKLNIFAKNDLGLPEGFKDLQPTRHDINIIYDRHRGLRHVLAKCLEGGRDWSYLLLEKLSPDFTTLFLPKFPITEAEPWMLPWELAEAGLLRIVVVDERAAEFSLDEVDGEQTKWVIQGLLRASIGSQLTRNKEIDPLKWHLAWAARIYVCTHFGIEGEAEVLHDKVNDRDGRPPFLKMMVHQDKVMFEQSVAGEPKKPIKADAVLIHQGVLDEWRDKLHGFEQNKFLNKLRRHFPFVVVESGRGIPPSLSDTEKFLPFSILQHNVLGNVVGKFGLARVLMSLARRGREG